MPSHSVRLGIAYMAAYAILQSLVWALVRVLSVDLSTETLFFFRNLIGVLTILPMLPKHGLSLFKTQRFTTHFWRALAAFIGGISIFYAVAHAPLGTVVAITFAAPIIASLTAIFLYKEPTTPAKLSALALGFIGVLMVVRPSLDAEWHGIAAAAIAAVATAAAFLLVKKLSSSESSQTVVAYPFLLLLPLSGAVAAFNWTMPGVGDIALLLLMGAGFSAAQYAMVKAFSFAEASAVLPIDYLRLIAASSIGILYFGDAADVWVYSGALLILIASVMTARQRRRAA